MKNPVRAGLSRLWATREKSQKNPPLRRFGDRLRKSYDPYPSDFGLRRLKFPFRTPASPKSCSVPIAALIQARV
jgi:hypothetical protein